MALFQNVKRYAFPKLRSKMFSVSEIDIVLLEENTARNLEFNYDRVIPKAKKIK